MSEYLLWAQGSLRNLGSFQQALFEAYRKADAQNRFILEDGFPHWFNVL